MSRLAIPLLFFCCAVLMPTGSAPAAPTTVPAAASRDMADAAGNLLAALTPDQKKQIRFEFSDVERFNWHFVPRARKGLPLKSMTPAQRHLAQALLASGLSQRGYISAVSIMSLEDVLKEMEKGKGPARDPELYFVSLFGDPGQGRPWGWRVEGHHISLNFTIVSGTVIASAPAFFGSNPGRVPEGPRKDLRILAQEEDLGRQLITSMNETQRKAAILPIAAPREIVTGNSRKATIDPAGIEFSSLGAPQQHLLMALVGLYANRLRTELAAHDLERITSAGIERIRFAWAGALESGKPHYYRIHGPTFLIEYDDTQNEANHIHTVWRDLEHDFGEDLLHEHYEEHARDPAHGH